MKTVEAGKRIALKNILFATDFSPCSEAALPYALSVARRYGATLHAAYVAPRDADLLLMSQESWPAAVELQQNRIEEYLEHLEKQLHGLPHDFVTPKGNVAEALAFVIEDRDIDLLVLGTHGRSGLSKLFLGSVAEEIFRSAICPVLSIGPYVPRQPKGEIRLYHILYATDFGEDSLAALPYALSFAEEDEANLTLLHVVEQPEAGIADLEEVKSSLMFRLKGLVPREAEPWCRVEYLVEFGQQFAPPAERIVEITRAQAADLIVLGARPARGKLRLGSHSASTTARVLTQAASPVLTVRANAE